MNVCNGTERQTGRLTDSFSYTGPYTFMCACTYGTYTYVRTVKKGDRVAQMILERICMAPVVEVETLPETARYAYIHTRVVV